MPYFKVLLHGIRLIEQLTRTKLWTCAGFYEVYLLPSSGLEGCQNGAAAEITGDYPTALCIMRL